MLENMLIPQWPAPDNVRAVMTTRLGGVSEGAYGSFNLGTHVGDDPAAVAANRLALARQLPSPPCWLQQVHGSVVREADPGWPEPPEADASFSRSPGVVCIVQTADCLPVLLCSRDGKGVAAVHAGWRGLVAGVLEEAVVAMRVPGNQVIAWLGPAIGPGAFEVGPEVRAAFMAVDPQTALAFRSGENGQWWGDLYLLARQRLAAVGVVDVYGGDHCTFSEESRFYSYRRDGATGRMAALVWTADA